MAQMTGKQAFLDILRQEGVRFIFGNPGSTELPLMDALVGVTDIRYILALQEAAVLGIADGFAQSSGEIACVNLHAAPGLGNALGMLYNAKKAGAPMLVTAGQQDQSIALTEPLLWDDLVSMARPLVKWSYEVASIEDLPRALHRACKVARTPPTGPVFLSIPGNILEAQGDIDLGHATYIATGWRGDAAEIERAATLIAAAHKPLIFAGDAVARSHALTQMVAFAEAVAAPVYAESVASSASFPSAHPFFAGSITRLSPALRAVLAQHDLIISIGGDLFTQSLASGVDAIPAGYPIVHLDNDAWELGKNYPCAVALLADPAACLPELTAAVTARIDPALAAARSVQVQHAIATRRSEINSKAAALQDQVPVQPQALLYAIGQSLPETAIIVKELLSSAPLARELLPATDAQSYMSMRGGGIGWALPAAVGAKLAHPTRPVLCLLGDGGMLYNIQALWTAAHEKLPLVVIIFNNRSYRILKQRTLALQGQSAASRQFVAMDLVDPMLDYASLSAGFGVAHHQVETVAEVVALMHNALAGDAPVVIEVMTASDV